MMIEVISTILEAESKAKEIVKNAEEDAKKIIIEAEATSERIKDEKISEMKAYRKAETVKATKIAQDEYERTLTSGANQASASAKSCEKNLDQAIDEIIKEILN